jgi:uncharacterized RDD family membrane protein YckC
MLRPPNTPPLTLLDCIARAQLDAPPLRRRLLAMIYEGVLLFGVTMTAGMIYGIAMQQKHALHDRNGLMAAIFLTLAVYFVWFWVRGGQTLAMKTWYLRVVREDGHPLTPFQAAKRYLAAWLWFLPPLGLAWLAHWTSSRDIGSLLLVWALFYACMSRLLPRKQALHDVICRTALIDTRP